MRFNFLRATYDFEKLYITNWQEMVFFYFFFLLEMKTSFLSAIGRNRDSSLPFPSLKRT